jgi:DNA repair photolyase
MAHELPIIHGRGTHQNPKNRFERLHVENDFEHIEQEDGFAESLTQHSTDYYDDTTKTIIAQNDSPDVGFTHSINPYRGCSHGCVYCFARIGHEYLGFSSGLDFETKIMVKKAAPELLRQELSSPRYKPVALMMSGVTDCYQPAEKKFQITRRCLEVLAEFKNPVSIITKNHLVTRDIDVLSKLAALDATVVLVSITTLDPELARRMEPRTSAPRRRLDAIRELTAAGIPAGVMVAPVIPGLTDHEMPSILKAAADAGARCAGYTPLRLALSIAGLFEQWLTDHFPDRKEKILNRIRSMRGGKLNDPRFGSRMRGEGIWADQLRTMFEMGKKAAGITCGFPELSITSFQRRGDQLTLW